MKISTRSKAVLASVMAVGLGFAASPALAQEVAYDDPTITAEPTVVTTAGWGDGVDVTLTLPAGVTADDVLGVGISMSAGTENAGDVLADVALEPEEGVDGVYSATLLPEQAPVIAEDENGPWVTVGGYYVYTTTGTDARYAISDSVVIDVIDAELAISGPAEATVSEITSEEGVTIELAGFQPEESIHVSGTSTTAGELTGAFDTTVGVNGRLTQPINVSDAEVGEVFTLTFAGESGTLTHTITIVADSGDEGGEEGGEEGDDDTGAPTPPERVDTGL